MSDRININSNSPFEKEIGFSRAIRAGNMLFVAGTAPIGEDGQTYSPGNLYEQTCRCFEISKLSIEAAGANMEHVVRTKLYLRDILQWKEAARAHNFYFKDIMPACTIVEVSRFINEDWLVETEIDCFIDSQLGQ